MENYTTLLNFSMDNATFAIPTNTTTELSWVYSKAIPIMLIVCGVSMLVNVRVLISFYWIRRPLSATLYISLSLAAADAFTSSLLCTGLVINSYIPVVYNIKLSLCYHLAIEALRLGLIITTVLHLVALACNHYLGIVRPLHYPSIMTHRKITACLIALWITPPIYFYVYFSLISGDGFQHEGCSYTFMKHLNFRLMFISLPVGSLVAMCFIYTHILVIVRRHQRSWAVAGLKSGSCRHRGTSVRRPARQTHDNRHHRQHQQMARNVKAVHTTLLILGSFITGLLPAIVVYILCCDDCLYRAGDVPAEVYMGVNLLVIVKTLVNPIIYAARMQEIKDATRRMQSSLWSRIGLWRWCGCRDTTTRRSRWEETDSQHLYNSGGSWRGCRLVTVSNGNTPHQIKARGTHNSTVL